VAVNRDSQLLRGNVAIQYTVLQPNQKLQVDLQAAVEDQYEVGFKKVIIFKRIGHNVYA